MDEFSPVHSHPWGFNPLLLQERVFRSSRSSKQSIFSLLPAEALKSQHLTLSPMPPFLSVFRAGKDAKHRQNARRCQATGTGPFAYKSRNIGGLLESIISTPGQQSLKIQGSIQCRSDRTSLFRSSHSHRSRQDREGELFAQYFSFYRGGWWFMSIPSITSL